ncbi:MAG: hypothetical protein WD342_03190 [Verrucomicrobiales bacterium]
MKKLLAIAAAAAALFAFVPTQAEAGHRSKVVGHCQHCHGNIHSYYKPVRCSSGYVRWTWVTSHHSHCAPRYSHSPSYYRPTYYRPTYYRPTYYRPSYSPGISLHFGGYRGGGYCR